MAPILVAPSILSADPLNLEDEIRSVEAGGADWHHIDVMDGHFVPNLSFGFPLIKALRKKAQAPLDVHIMIDNPDQYALDYVEAGAGILTFHAEASRHPHRLIQVIKKAGAKAGIALNPGTPLSACEPLLPDVDMVLLMSVNPGFGGQAFIPGSTQRIRRLKEMALKANRGDLMIQVDGGISKENAREVCEAGANVLVAGSWVYGSPDRAAAISALKKS